MPTSDKRVTAATAEVGALVTRLAQAGSAVVSDVLDECGFSTQVLDNALEALAEARKRRFSHIKWLRTSR